MVVRLIVFLSSANRICRSTDSSKCFIESHGIRVNESRLYFVQIVIRYLVADVKSGKMETEIRYFVVHGNRHYDTSLYTETVIMILRFTWKQTL